MFRRIVLFVGLAMIAVAGGGIALSKSDMNIDTVEAKLQDSVADGTEWLTSLWQKEPEAVDVVAVPEESATPEVIVWRNGERDAALPKDARTSE